MFQAYLPPLGDRAGVPQLGLRMAQDLGPKVFARQSLALRDRPDQQATLTAFEGPALVLMG